LSLKATKDNASDTGVGADAAGADANASGKSVVSLAQQPSSAPELADFTGWLSDVGLFDNLVAEINRDLTLPAPIHFVLQQCGPTPDGTKPSLKAGDTQLCYEWLKSGYDAATAQNVEAPPE
jgi:hypothetical protein